MAKKRQQADESAADELKRGTKAGEERPGPAAAGPRGEAAPALPADKPVPRFRVAFGDEPAAIIAARDAVEARAIVNTQRGTSHGPRDPRWKVSVEG